MDNWIQKMEVCENEIQKINQIENVSINYHDSYEDINEVLWERLQQICSDQNQKPVDSNPDNDTFIQRWWLG